MMQSYQVFPKTFHVPIAWMEKAEIVYLVNHSYAKEEAATSLTKITENLKTLGYMEDHNMMIHDYLQFMIQDMLDKNGEIYITENDIRNNSSIKDLLCGMTPDFVIKRNDNRTKTIIFDVYVGTESDIKGKYKALSFFADFRVVTPHNFTSQLSSVLPKEDIEYLYKNFQIFLTEYYYWRACIKLRKVLYNDAENIKIETFPEVPDDQKAAKIQYERDLSAYAIRVADESLI